MDVTIEGVRCSMRKVDISSKAFEIADLFEIGEDIKVYVLSTSAASGEVRLSTRALEFKQGALQKSKAEVFERAEETAAKYFKRAQKAKKDKFSEVEKALGDLKASGGSKDILR